jgi:hypothetical protein
MTDIVRNNGPTDLVKGMARVAFKAQYGALFDPLRDGVRDEFMRAALIWLAENVSDEMLDAAEKAAREHKHGMRVNDTKCDQRNMLAKQFAAAIRAAAMSQQSCSVGETK